jgi:glycosyltransferase involved in cell wall biosynthesis/GT2 family glycosyltransferase
MKIAIDLRTVTFGEAGGLVQWLQGALGRLIRTDRDNEYLVFGMPYNYHLLDFQAPNLRRVTFSSGNYEKGIQDRLDFEKDVEVLFRCFPHDRKLNFPAHRQIVCIPDRRHELYPEDYPGDVRLERRRTFRYYQGMAGAIGTFSDFARRDLLACPWTTCQDVFLMPPALPEPLAEPETEEAGDEIEAQLDSPFFLYPANLWPHKNHAALLEAFARFHEINPDVGLILTGHRDAWRLFAKEYHKHPVRHLGYVSPRLLAALYRRALALVYPSLHETFGLPLLEAFAAGVPVLCSQGMSLEEVGGDAVLTCDPRSIDSLVEGMVRIASDEPLRRQLAERGRARLACYSWEETASALRGAIERVAERARAHNWYAASAPPLVSIVTPSFEQGRFIRRTIESVLSQDYPHVDFRVVDGGSTDETLEVLKSYGDRFPWVSEKDRGQTHAINKGLAQAKGQILSYLNSDDILRPGAVSRVVKHFLTRPACDLVYGRDAYVDVEENFLGWFPTAEFSFEKLIENCCISQPAAFWRDRIMAEAGPFDENLYSVMDYEYWMRLDRAGALIEYVPELLASTRIHPEAKTSGGTDYQWRRYREMFLSSLRHAGYVSPMNLKSYLMTCLYPRWPWLESFPQTTMQAVEAWFSYRHVNGCRLSGAVARTAERALFSLLGMPKISPITFIREKFRKWRADNKPRLPYLQWGPRLHNILGQKTVAAAGVDRGRDELRLTGRPLCDTTLSLKIGKEEAVRAVLKAGELTDLRVPLARVKDDPRLITVEFSHSTTCPVRGSGASFELHGTNLFGERFFG